MSIFDKFKKQLGQRGDKVEQGMDRAGKAADARTKGKYSRQIRSGTEKAKEAARQQGRGGQSGGRGGGEQRRG